MRSLRQLLDDLIANVADDVLEARLQYSQRTESTRAEILDRYEPAAEQIGRHLAAGTDD